MTTFLDRVPTEEITARSKQVRPGRVLLTVLTAIGVAIGWAIAKFFRSIGWLAGRFWLIGAHFAESVIWGFREGAGLSQPSARQESQPGPPPGPLA